MPHWQQIGKKLISNGCWLSFVCLFVCFRKGLCMKFFAGVFVAVALLCSSVSATTATVDTGSLDDATYSYFTLSCPTRTTDQYVRVLILDDELYPRLYFNVQQLISGTWQNVSSWHHGTDSALFALPVGSTGGSFRIKHDSATGILPCELYIYDLDNPSDLSFLGVYPGGDSNLDQHFNSSDLVAVAAAGKYETNQAATWAQGDWNRDGYFNSSDFVYVMQLGTYEGTDLEDDWDAAN